MSEDFSEHPHLLEAIFVIGEQYYNKARLMENEGLTTEAADYYRKTISIWERVIQQLPASAAYTPRFYYISAVIYSQELGEHNKEIEYYHRIVNNWPDYKYAWHAQFFMGKYYEKLRSVGSLPESEANAKIEEAYKWVIKKYPYSSSTPYAVLKLGQLNFKREDFNEAFT